MELVTEQRILPEQKAGGHTGATARMEMDTRHAAILLFNNAKERLLAINHWKELCGKGSASFLLTDEDGTGLINVHPRVGHLIRIELPAPKNKTGAGYDWVRIEAFENTKNLLKDEEVFGFRVRPVKAPTGNDRHSAHFYTNAATSTFLIIRRANYVSAIERGRNEIPNTGPSSILNKIRNSAIAIAAMIGFSNPQWKCLMNGVLNGRKD